MPHKSESTYLGWLAAKKPLFPGREQNMDKTLSVLLDPGHGGHVVGCVWEDAEAKRTFCEKDVTLAITEALTVAITAPNVAVHRSRTSDMYVPDRARVREGKPVDLILSVHAHSGDRGAPSGVHACVADLNDTYTVALADKMVETVAAALKLFPTTGKDKITTTKSPVIRAGDSIRDGAGFPLSVLRRPAPEEHRTRPMRKFATPAILLVLGRLDDAAERKALLSTKRIEEAARALAEIIMGLAPTSLKPEKPELRPDLGRK